MLPSTVKFASRMKRWASATACASSSTTARLVLGGARVVDVPRHGPPGRRRAERRPQEVEGRGPRRSRTARRRRARRAISRRAQCLAGARPRRHEGPDRQQGTQIVDARADAALRGHGARAAPWPAAGHIPGSRNVPFDDAPQCRRHAEADGELRKIFAGAGIDPHPPVVTTCGSGVTACVIRWRSPCSARPTPPSTTARGPSGAPTTAADRDRPGEASRVRPGVSRT